MELEPDGTIKKSHTEIISGKEIRVIDELVLDSKQSCPECKQNGLCEYHSRLFYGDNL